jgi:hypothetical protein
VQHPRFGATARRRDDPGHVLHPAVPYRRQQRNYGRFSFTSYHRVHGTFSLCEHVFGHEGHAVPAEEDEAVRGGVLCRAGEVDRLGDVGQVVQ